MFLGGAVSSSAFFINNGLQVIEINRGGEFTTSENENLDDVTANAPTNDGYWTDAGNYATSFAGGSGTSTDPYLISTPQQLAYLSYLLNTMANVSFRGAYYDQTANLDMSKYWWDSIGTSECYFDGNYNGNNYTISGLYTKSGITADYSYQGLFSYAHNSARISNVHIINSDIQGYSYVGGIAGKIENGTRIFQCSMSGSVRGEDVYVGGLVGYASQISSRYLLPSITTSYNTADVVGGSYVGGIVGNCDTYSSSSNAVIYCFNLGDVSGNNRVGGIVGYASGLNNNSDYYRVKISQCYNRGNVSGTSNVGGIVGYIEDMYIHHCYNTGIIDGGDTVGSITGFTTRGNVYDCFNAGSSLAITGSDGYMVNRSSIYVDENYENCLNLEWYQIDSNWRGEWYFDTTWAMDENINDGLPYLIDVHASMVVTITYHPNGASGSEVVESKVGSESYTIRSNMFTRSGYNFTGWNSQANGGGTSYSAGSSYSELANLDLYAQWSRITYTIKYNKNASDATGSMANTTKYYGTNVTLRSNAFKRTGYSFAGWATEKGGNVVYSNGATYTANANVTLYAKWTAHKYTVKFNGNGSTSGSMKEQTFTYGTAQKLTSNAFKKTGFTFSKWTRNADGTGTSYTNGQSVSNLTSSNGATINLYAQWTARNEAKYDSAGKYWYIENGKIPQTKVTNSTLISNLNKATTNGSNYYIAGQTLTAKVYSGKEYCKWNNNWYEVEPIKWRLDASSSQKDGYGTTTDTNAVLAEIVYVDQYSSTSIDAGEGYSSQSVTDFMRNGISTTYLVNYTTSTQTFGSGTSLYGTNASTTARMFVSSQSEITNVVGNMNMTFSDLVEDMIKYYGGTNVYFTRDLGSNYNNIVCFNEVGREVQRFATDYRGVQFTVRFTEYGCVN